MPLPRRIRHALVALAAALALAPSAPAVAAPVPPEATSAASSSGEVTRVVVISVDGLNPAVINRLGPQQTPGFHRLMDEGAWTFNARTAVEQTVTLPNHTGMLTSRRIDRHHGGHGVTWDDDRRRPRTVQAAAGHSVASVFSALRAAGLSSAMFASKDKFSLYQRSWSGVNRSVIRIDNRALVNGLRYDLRKRWREFTFVHLSAPDLAGHKHGWFTPAYNTAVRHVDELLGQILDTVSADRHSRRHTVVVLTADHGGKGHGHSNAMRLADYRIPFMVWGTGVPEDTDLYDLNPTYADPGRAQVPYADAEQPIRNGAVGNLVLDLLGLPALPKSEINAAQDLEVSAPAG